MRLKLCVSLLVLSAAVLAARAQNDVPADVTNIENDVIRKLNAGCAKREPSACMKLKILAYMNKLMKKASIELTEDVVLTQTVEVPVQFVSSSPRDLEDDDGRLMALVGGKARSFLQSRELHWKFMEDTEVVLAAGKESSSLNVRLAFDQGRAAQTARLHKIKGLFVLAAAAITKVGLLASLKFAGLVALVFKALIVSKIALALAVIVGVSKLLNQQHVTTYEVVSHPHVSHSSGLVGSSLDTSAHGHHDSYSSSVGYGRSGVTADKLAYSAHVPK